MNKSPNNIHLLNAIRSQVACIEGHIEDIKTGDLDIWEMQDDVEMIYSNLKACGVEV